MKASLVRPILALLLFSVCTQLLAVESGRAKGTVLVNGEKRVMKFAYAKEVKNDEGVTEYHVLLSDRALFPSLLADESNWSSAIKSQGGTLTQLVFVADKSIQQAQVHDGLIRTSTIPMSGSDIEATLASFSSKSISGSAKTTEEQEFFDQTASFDVEFSAAVGAGMYGENLAAIAELEPKFKKLNDGAASGTLTVAGQKTTLSHVYALSVPGEFDEKKRDTLLVLSDKPIDDAVLADPRKLSDEGSRGKYQGLLIRVNDEKKPYSMELFHYEGQTTLMGNGFMGLEALKLDEKAAVGRLFTLEPQSLQGSKAYEYDVSYRAAVRTLEKPREPGFVDAKNGTRLPAGGGDPGKAYLAFSKAVASGNIGDMKKFASAEQEMPPLDPKDPETKELLEFMKLMQPKNIKIVEGWIAGDNATLTVTGDEEGGKSTGTIFMKKEQGTWRVGNQKWKTVMN